MVKGQCLDGWRLRERIQEKPDDNHDMIAVYWLLRIRRSNQHMNRFLAVSVVLTLSLAGCTGSLLAPSGQANLTINFRAARSDLTPPTSGVSQPVVLTGANGLLTIDDVRFIVAEFELERTDEDCDDAIDEHSCEELHAPPQFLKLPLGGEAVTAITQNVPVGIYKELEFEVEDLELDEDEHHGIAAPQDLLDQIRGEFPDWPIDASMLVTGNFAPVNGATPPTPFRVYFEAEIEIEQDFRPPLVILEGDLDKTVTITVDLSAWFTRPDGTIRDLSQFDFDSTGKLVEFEVEMEDGFTDVEFDD